MSATKDSEWLGTTAVVVLAVCAVALTLGNVRRAFFPSAAMLTEPSDSLPTWREIAAAGDRVGPSQAPVTLVVFSDYQCPSCRQLFLRVEAISKNYPEDVAVVWRHLPLGDHAFAMPAARASVCAAEQGRFETMHGLLFRLRDSLGMVTWSSLARRAGVKDTSTFGSCLERASTQARIDTDLVAARAIHAVVTPTVLVNEFEYNGTPPDLARIVRFARRRAARAR